MSPARRTRSTRLSYHGEQLVTGREAQAVVDDLEMVEVEEQQPDAARGRARVRVGERLRERLEQHDPVRKLGQWIVPGPVLEQGLDPLVLRDVVDNAEQAALVARVLRHLHDLDVERAAAVLERHVERHRLPLAAGAGERGDVRHEHVGREHGAEVAAEIGLGVEIEQRPVAGVGVDELADLVVADPHDERGLRERVEDNLHVGVGARGRAPAALRGALLTRVALPTLRLRALHASAFP